MAREKRQMTLDELRRRYLERKVAELRDALEDLPDARQQVLFADAELWWQGDHQDQGKT